VLVIKQSNGPKLTLALLVYKILIFSNDLRFDVQNIALVFILEFSGPTFALNLFLRRCGFVEHFILSSVVFCRCSRGTVCEGSLGKIANTQEKCFKQYILTNEKPHIVLSLCLL